ncbi:MAG: PAS domain-containing protein, partial [Altererythrobacter ishigakiensis]|nr:PAS domain-containing protein [Altererythrobacter ishigakiensis]
MYSLVLVFLRKRERRAFRRLLQQTRLSVDASGEGMFGIDDRGMISFVNDAALRMLDYEKGALAGKPAHLVLHQDWSRKEHHALES